MVQKTEPEMEAIWILRENTPFSRKRELDLLLETAKPKVASSILSTMYKQINSVRRIDFVEIDKSKGDFKKLSFVKTIDDALGYLEKEADATETKIIRTAEANLISMKKQFMDAYKIGSDLDGHGNPRLHFYADYQDRYICGEDERTVREDFSGSSQEIQCFGEIRENAEFIKSN